METFLKDVKKFNKWTYAYYKFYFLGQCLIIILALYQNMWYANAHLRKKLIFLKILSYIDQKLKL